MALDRSEEKRKEEDRRTFNARNEVLNGLFSSGEGGSSRSHRRLGRHLNIMSENTVLYCTVLYISHIIFTVLCTYTVYETRTLSLCANSV